MRRNKPYFKFCRFPMALALVLAAPLVWAIYVTPIGSNEVEVKDAKKPVAQVTLTGLIDGQEITKTAETDNGKVCIKREEDATEDDRKKPYCIIIPGDGKYYLNGRLIEVKDGAVSVPWLSQRSNTELAGGAVGTAVVAVALASSGSNSTQGTPVADSSSGGGSPQVAIEINPSSLAGVHFVGSTICPQILGTIRVTNTGNAPGVLRVFGDNASVHIAFQGLNQTVQPGETVELLVAFVCTTTTSFTTNLTIKLEGQNNDAPTPAVVQVTIN